MVRVLEEMEEYAKENNIPIMLKDGIDFLTNYIKENKCLNILEIGSAIGYSSIKMALVDENIKITTIERDETRYNMAVDNIKKAHLDNRINIILNDAFDDKYDLIFIDAAKSQYIKFFLKFKENLKDNGVIVSDNLHFHGLVNTDKKIESRNVRQLVRKINDYIIFLKDNKEFNTIFYDIGDGIAISSRVN